MATDPIRFTDELRVRCSPQMANAVHAAAKARGIRISDWIREAASTCLCLDGITKYPKAPKEYPMTKDDDVKLKPYIDPVSGKRTDDIGAKGSYDASKKIEREQRRESNPSR
jgi:hypothetical protein